MALATVTAKLVWICPGCKHRFGLDHKPHTHVTCPMGCGEFKLNASTLRARLIKIIRLLPAKGGTDAKVK